MWVGLYASGLDGAVQHCSIVNDLIDLPIDLQSSCFLPIIGENTALHLPIVVIEGSCMNA